VKWTPYHRFEFASPHSRDAAVAGMEVHVEPVKWFRVRWPSASNDEKFEGEITQDDIRVRRVLGYNNSFAPMSRIVVHPAARGSRVEVTMAPHPFVLVFVAIWCLGVAGVAMYAGQETVWFPLVMLLVVAAMVYGITLAAFWYEASKQERTLRRIFGAT
jgi:hypothetical protein